MNLESATTILASVAAVVASIAAFLAFIASRRTFASDKQSQRRKVFDAVYYHIERVEEFLREQPATNQKVRKQIKKDPDYTPYCVGSIADDLTYDLIIELLENLDLADSDMRIVLLYFHSHNTYQSIMASFNSDYVRSWSAERKLGMWDGGMQYQTGTLRLAGEAKDILDKVRAAGICINSNRINQ